MVKDLSTKNEKGGRNYQDARPPYQRQERFPRLQDMPYKKNWKDGKPVFDNHETQKGRDTPDPLKKNIAHNVERIPWCVSCNMPYSPF